MSSHAQPQCADNGDRNRRRKYLINPSFQWKYALITATAVFLITSILSSILYGLLHHQARMRVMYPETYTAEVTLIILAFGVAFAGIAAVGVGIWCVMVTHRFCGPLYVMERHLVALAQGRIPRLRDLRRKDEFKEFYATFRRAVDALRDSRIAELAIIEQALATARTAAQADDASRRQALELLITQFGRLQGTVQKGLSPAPCDAAGETDAVTDVAPASPVPLA